MSPTLEIQYLKATEGLFSHCNQYILYNYHLGEKRINLSYTLGQLPSFLRGG